MCQDSLETLKTPPRMQISRSSVTLATIWWVICTIMLTKYLSMKRKLLFQDTFQATYDTVSRIHVRPVQFFSVWTENEPINLSNFAPLFRAFCKFSYKSYWPAYHWIARKRNETSLLRNNIYFLLRLKRNTLSKLTLLKIQALHVNKTTSSIGRM